MSMNMTDYLEGKLVEHALGLTTFTKPTTVYLALHTADPTEVGNVAEISGNAYARTAITFGAHSGGTCLNSADVLFPQASGGNWGTLSHASIWDSASGGNTLFYGALTASKVINDTEQLRIPTGSLSVQMV